ncbi:MAG: histidine phosphatase family protein [Acidobacteria bacterium]|nr:histidine phosphatase family protein [Acidobacteriota bacterium]
MKLWLAFFIGVFLIAPSTAEVFSQKRTITVMIFRHADKEEPVEGDDSEPDISLDGQRRALRLVGVLEKYKPMRLYSTRYARAIETVTPLSRIKNLPIQFYEPGAMEKLVAEILSFTKRRRVAVVGHNSTAFQLVNLFLKESKYTMPADSDYGKIWILRIKNGKVKDKVIVY